MAGFDRPDAGTIQVEGKDVTRIAPSKRDMGMVFQAYSLFPNMTAAQNVEFGLKIRGRDLVMGQLRCHALSRFVPVDENDRAFRTECTVESPAKRRSRRSLLSENPQAKTRAGSVTPGAEVLRRSRSARPTPEG